MTISDITKGLGVVLKSVSESRARASDAKIYPERDAARSAISPNADLHHRQLMGNHLNPGTASRASLYFAKPTILLARIRGFVGSLVAGLYSSTRKGHLATEGERIGESIALLRCLLRNLWIRALRLRKGEREGRRIRYDPRGPDLRFMSTLRWIFRLIAMAIVGKFLNQYLASRGSEPRPQEVT